MTNETEQFLKDTEIPKENILETPLNPETEVPEKETEDAEMKAKNRRERRLMKHNQELREEAIALNARLQAISETKESVKGTEAYDFEKLVEKIYGNATPETAEATEIMKKALRGAFERAKEEAKSETLAEWDSRQSNESQAVAEEESNLDEILENLEDEHGVDLSEGSDTRQGYLTLLEKLSPKDSEGNIIEYADPETTFEIFSSRQERTNNRAKELASRSMVRGGTGTSKIEQDSNERFLREAGII